MLPRIAAAVLRIGRAATPYGIAWTRYTAAGDGIGSARIITRAGAITGYVVQQLPSALALALAGANVPKATWWFVTTDAVTLGDTIQNVSATSVIYTIETADGVGDITICRLSIGGTTA